MGENIVGNFTLGSIQNGSFVPIVQTDNIKTFKDDSDTVEEANNYCLHGSEDFSFECKLSRKSRTALERLCLYGWRNKMPFRKRLLRKVINNRVERDWRRFVNGD